MHESSPEAPSEHEPWPEHGVVEPPAHSTEQSLDAKPESQTQEPSLCAVPCPEHVVASEYWHKSPTQPASQAVHVPSFCAVPRPEHVDASEYVHRTVTSDLEERGCG